MLGEAPTGGFMRAAVVPWVGHPSWAVRVKKREWADWLVG